MYLDEAVVEEEAECGGDGRDVLGSLGGDGLPYYGLQVGTPIPVEILRELPFSASDHTNHHH